MSSNLLIAGAVIAVTAMLCLAVLNAWRGWLELKRLELAEARAASEVVGDEVTVRIELAAVKERVKKLEAIASGVEL